MNSEEVSTFWNYERQWYQRQDRPGTSSRSSTALPTLLIKDIYTDFFGPKLNATRLDWDNLSNDQFYLDIDNSERSWESWQLERMKSPKSYNNAEKKAHLSFEDCGRACKSLGFEECFQYSYVDGLCAIHRSFILGKPVRKEDDERKRMMSGWDVRKIETWIANQGECEKVLWPEMTD
jgi:hypothetical protein